jgi:Flp pilus assembly protein TadG
MMRGASRAFRSARLTWQRLLKDERGSVVAFFVALPVIAGTLAVGVETGQLYRTKRQMQGAADAAALAGTVDKMNGGTDVTATALYEAQRNGFQNGVNGVTVTVTSPPTSGTYAGNSSAVEVSIRKNNNKYSLAAVLSSTLGNAFTMSSRAVAASTTSTSYQDQTVTTTTSTSSADGCLLALADGVETGVSFTSFNNFTSDCYIYSNARGTGTTSTTSSVYMSGFNNARVKQIYARGSVTVPVEKMTYTAGGSPQINQTTAIVDPYASLATPTPGDCTYTNYNNRGGTSITVSPGTYCGGLEVGGTNNVYFLPGIYYIANGDLYISSANNVSCPTCTTNSGIAFVMTQTTGNNADIGGVRISSDNNISFNASSASQPSPPPYAGVLFYQDRRVANGTMSSTSKIFTISSLNTVSLTGAIYFPNNRIDISSINNANMGTNGCTVWIGRYIKFSSYNNNYVAGCSAIGVTKPGIITTTTTTQVVSVPVTSTRGKVLE